MIRRCLSYTHDRDYEAFRDVPKGIFVLSKGIFIVSINIICTIIHISTTLVPVMEIVPDKSLSPSPPLSRARIAETTRCPQVRILRKVLVYLHRFDHIYCLFLLRGLPGRASMAHRHKFSKNSGSSHSEGAWAKAVALGGYYYRGLLLQGAITTTLLLLLPLR